MLASNQRIMVAHMFGKAWEVMIFRVFKKTGCVITKNSDDDEFIQPQWFCGYYNSDNGNFFEMQPLQLSASQISEKNPDEDEVIEGFGDVMIDSTVNSGGEEIIEDDDGDRVEEYIYIVWHKILMV